MTDTYHITDIRTGEGLDSDRVAVFAAPSGAAAGSLEPLTRFFHEHGYDAQLGYSGAGKDHVLRLHGFADDLALRTLLQQGYPRWEHRQNIANSAHDAHIRFPDDLTFQPLDTPPAQRKRSFTQAIRDKSTGLSATAYMAGNIGLAFSALYGGGQGKQKEFLKLGAPVCYTMASAFLFFLDSKRPEPRSMEAIWESLSPDLLRDDYTPTPKEERRNREAGAQSVGHVWDFMTKHPWEISGLLNMIGAGSHMTSSLLHGQRTEALAALSTLTAMAITTFVPEKGKHANFAEKAFAPVGGVTALGSAQLLEEQHGIFQSFFDAGKKLTDWLQEKPLRAASFIQLAANTGYGIAALKKTDGDGNRAVDWGLLASSGTFITGNGFQAIATKIKGPGYDDIVTKVARVIARQTDWQDIPREQLRTRLMRVASALTEQPEISQPEDQLAAGILARLERKNDGPTEAETALEGFIPTEKDTLKSSPFISPHKVESELAVSPQRG